MKKILLSLTLAALCGNAMAYQQALYVKKGDYYSKYNFGVAGDLNFSDGGHTLRISGYNDIINLDEIDHISFNAPMMDALTPSEQKERLVEIGREFMNLADLKSVAEGIRFGDALSTYHNGCQAPADYDVSEEIQDLFKDFTEFSRSAARAAKADPAAIRTMRSRATDIVRLSDYFGVYKANHDKEEWEKAAPADYLEIQFSHKAFPEYEYRMRLTASAEEDSWETSDGTVCWPRSLEITFFENNKKFATYTQNFRMQKEELISIDSEFTAAAYRLTDNMHIDNKVITDYVELFVDGAKVLTANTVINGNRLLDADSMIDDITEATHYHDEDGNCMGDDPTALAAHFYRARTEVDLLGKLQVRGNMFDFSRMCEIMQEDDEDVYFNRISYMSITDDKSMVYILDSDPLERCEEQLSYLNNYLDAQFFYDRETKLQGFLTSEIVENHWDNERWYDMDGDGNYLSGYADLDGALIWVRRDSAQSPYYYDVWNDETSQADRVEVKDSIVLHPAVFRYMEYEIHPLLMFPDMTGYDFEDFFDEASFTKLIDDCEDIVDVFNTIVFWDDPMTPNGGTRSNEAH